MLEDPIQKTDTSACGLFQIYFYDNLFFPGENSKLHSYKKLAKEATKFYLMKCFHWTKSKLRKL